MATLYGIQATLLLNQTIPYNIPAQYQNARAKMYIDSYTLPAATDFGSADVIQFYYLPAAALIVSSVVDYGAFGGSCAGTLGNAASAESTPLEAAGANSLLLSTNISSAGRTTMTTETFKNHVLLSKVLVQFALSAVSSSAGGKTLTARIELLQYAGS